jgi:hypothetical protein
MADRTDSDKKAEDVSLKVFTREIPIRYLEDSELEQTFRRLADEWRDETIMYSLVLQKTAHPAYLRIIGMGEKAIPLILREIQERGGYWFVALSAISGEDPVQPGSNYEQAAQAWLKWGKDKGYIE